MKVSQLKKLIADLSDDANVIIWAYDLDGEFDSYSVDATVRDNTLHFDISAAQKED